MPHISIPCSETILHTLRGAAVGAMVHTAGGAISGSLGSLILSNGSFSAALGAKIGAIGGVITGSIGGGARGLFRRHFEPWNIATVSEALAEVGMGLLLNGVGAFVGGGVAATDQWSANLASAGISTALVLATTATAVGVHRVCSCYFSSGAGLPTTGSSAPPSSMLTRLSRRS